MKKFIPLFFLLTTFMSLSACVPRSNQYSLNTLIGENYAKLEAKCPQCFDYRLTGTADGAIHLPDGRSFRKGEPNPSAVVYRATPTETEYLRTWLVSCTYILTVRKSDGIITSWRYATEDRKNCVVW
jgi:hypothetical protein